MVILREYVVVPNPVSSLTRAQPIILVDATGHARITDFGLATVARNFDSARSSGDQGHTARWTAPEILSEEASYSKEADVFAFAMVAIEVRHQWSICVEPWLTTILYHHRYSPAPFHSIMACLGRPC